MARQAIHCFVRFHRICYLVSYWRCKFHCRERIETMGTLKLSCINVRKTMTMI